MEDDENENSMREELLFETKSHASGPCSSNYPPQLAEESEVGGIRWRAIHWFRGVKDSWSRKINASKIHKNESLFVSPNGAYIAIAAGNQITILPVTDDYQEPSGIFTCGRGVVFTCGSWSEIHDVLGLSDDSDTLYFIQPNGEEIAKISKRQLNISAPVLGLVSLEKTKMHKSSMCGFMVISQDGFRFLEVIRGSNASISSMAADGVLLMRKVPENIFCFDYNKERDLLVLVGSVAEKSGRSESRFSSCGISVSHLFQNSDTENIFATQFEGLYNQSKDYAEHIICPKVVISPSCSFIASLDIRGLLHIFKLSNNGVHLIDAAATNERSNIVDFTWWSDCILAVTKKNGTVNMLNASSKKLLRADNSSRDILVMEKALLLQECIYILEVKSLETMPPVEKYPVKNSLYYSKSCWTLKSICGRSVQEMYQILIDKHHFSEALELALRYDLDKDAALKSQWVHSRKGINDINTILANIKDHRFVISECLVNIGPTEDVMKEILVCGLQVTDLYRNVDAEVENSEQMCKFRMYRLRLLRFSDMLETYIGINMGRFSAVEYGKFRTLPINQSAITLAENGKLGAVNLLFKRHPYSLSPYLLDVLASVPETINVETYGQLLPGRHPPANIFLREEDWVECVDVISDIRKQSEDFENMVEVRTESVEKQCCGYIWPSIKELTSWYKSRALDIDKYTGQLDNCICLLDQACLQGIIELQRFRDDVRYLYQLIYSNDDMDKVRSNMSLEAWEKLSDYEKFTNILSGVTERNLANRLRDMAIPFMKERQSPNTVTGPELTYSSTAEESFIVAWLKKIASENKLDLCLIAVEEGCKDIENGKFFMHEIEAIDCALQCIYMCTVTDKWNTMDAILSKLPSNHAVRKQPSSVDKKLRLAEGHIEAGRLLAFYQVPKPISFFVGAHLDEKGTKQILRLILSKFVRRQPGRSDTEWANMWRDLLSLRDKAFTFLDPEFMLIEYCRGLLKAGKFSLARNYLSGTSSVTLASEKAESLVIQAARDYFFSASSFSCLELWKAKECLSILPSSSNVKAEEDIIVALTEKLPDLGVSLLPVQFRQIQDPLDIIKMAITSHSTAYLRVDDLIEVSKLLGIRSPDEISAVEEAIAREAAIAGDLQLAFDLCLVLARKGYGTIWDLCAAIARGPELENMDFNSRKHLLGFALSYCDEDSVGELLNVWIDWDLQGKYASVISGTEISYHKRDLKQEDDADNFNLRDPVALVLKTTTTINGSDVDLVLQQNRKFKSFAAFQLPRLLDLCSNNKRDESCRSDVTYSKLGSSLEGKATLVILSWLAHNSFASKDNLIAILAKEVINPPVTELEDLEGCLLLLNLVDAPSGVEVIEEQLKLRSNYQEICSIMKVGMIYSSLHDAAVECKDPSRRRELLSNKFREEHMQLVPDEVRDQAQTTFWRDWKMRLEEKKSVAERSRMVEEIIPGVETSRFLSGDSAYIETAIISLIDSLKLSKKHVINDALKLVDTYGLRREEVLQHFLCAVLLSEAWSEEDIMAELSGFREEIINCADETIKTVSEIVFPAIDGRNKPRLSIVFSLLSDCYSALNKRAESSAGRSSSSASSSFSDYACFYRVLEQECRRTSSLHNLNFKNVARLDGLNLRSFRNEVFSHIDDCSLEVLAKMVQELLLVRPDPSPEGIGSWRDVYKHYLLGFFAAFESRVRADLGVRNASISEAFLDSIAVLEQNLQLARKYIRLLSPFDGVQVLKLYYTVVVYLYAPREDIHDNSTWQECLLALLSFWIRLTEEMIDTASYSDEKLLFNPRCFSAFLKIMMDLLMDDRVSPRQAWGTIVDYVTSGFTGDPSDEIRSFCRAMMFSGCGFKPVFEVLSVSTSQLPETVSIEDDDLCPSKIYISSLEQVLEKLTAGSDENQRLYSLLNSLSKVEDHLEELHLARRVVWERLAQFSDDLRLPSEIRVFVLEAMQYISGKNIKGFSHLLESNVSPWESWDPVLPVSGRDLRNLTGNSSRFTTTLVALRSSQLLSATCSVEITAEDLSTVESAVSCFSKLCAACDTAAHLRVLASILEEWDGVFLPMENDASATAEEENPKTEDDWRNDNWDEGWETIPEEEIPAKEKTPKNAIHPLHACWFEICKNLIKFSHLGDLLKLIDEALSRPDGVALLDEEETMSLALRAAEIDCIVACDVSLLLPYESVQLHCLKGLEGLLGESRVRDTGAGIHAFLTLLLSAGRLSSIVRDPSLGNTFSFVCYLMGNYSRRCQEAELCGGEDAEAEFFQRVAMPAFVAELVNAEEPMLAGLVACRIAHTNAALGAVNVAAACLRAFLQCLPEEHLGGTLHLKVSCLRLRDRLRILIPSALRAIPLD